MIIVQCLECESVLVPQYSGETVYCACKNMAYINGRRFQRYGSANGNIFTPDVCEVFTVKSRENSVYDIQNIVRKNRRPVLAVIKNIIMTTYKLYEYDISSWRNVRCTTLFKKGTSDVS